MKKKISLNRPKTRAIELFANSSPFKPKIVRSKLLYKRKEKHLNTMFNLD